MPFFGVHRTLLPALGHIALGPGLLLSFSDQNKDGSIKHSRIRSAVNFQPSAYMDGPHQYILALCGNGLTQQLSCHTQFVRQLQPCINSIFHFAGAGVVSGGKVSHFSLSFAVADVEFKATSQSSKCVSDRNILGV